MGELSERDKALIVRTPGTPSLGATGFKCSWATLQALLDAARTEGRGDQEPVAWRWRPISDPGYGWAVGAEKPPIDPQRWEIQPLYASPIREPEISEPVSDPYKFGREAVDIEKLLRENLPATCGLHCQREQTQAEEDAAYRDTADATLNLAPVEGWAISKDGPHEISDTRKWLARQLLDSKLDDGEALGIVAYSPAITDLAPVGGRGEGWRPINEAPRDGSPILAASTNHEAREVVCWWDGEDSGSIDADAVCEGWVNAGAQKDRFYANPRWFTHWQPLPPPPQEQGGMK